MSISQAAIGENKWRVVVDGRLDQTQSGSLQRLFTTLLDQDQIYLIVDLTEVTYINSGGLRCLVTAWRKARQLQGDLVLCGLSERLQDIFKMIGFDKFFQIHDSCADVIMVESQKTTEQEESGKSKKT